MLGQYEQREAQAKGSATPPSSHFEGDVKLGRWVTKQRQAYSNGRWIASGLTDSKPSPAGVGRLAMTDEYARAMANSGELRIALSHEGSYALVAWVRVAGKDIYFGSPLPNLYKAKVSHRKSGRSHVKVSDPSGIERELRDSGGLQMPVSEVKGSLLLGETGQPSSSALDWNYPPKGDSKNRRTLILDSASLPPTWSLALWAIEEGRGDLVEEILAGKSDQVLLDHLLMDRTRPQILAVVWTLSPEVWKEFEVTVSRGGRPDNFSS